MFPTRHEEKKEDQVLCIVWQILTDDQVEMYGVNSVTNVFILKTCTCVFHFIAFLYLYYICMRKKGLR